MVRRLHHSQISRHQCVLELGDYSTAQRARILYNHLHFSDLPPEYCDEMLHDDFFLTVIKHDNFSPRIIEWLASYTRLHAVPAAAYQQHVAKLLASPDSIWAHAFNHQISDAARHVLISFYTLGQWVETSRVEPAFLALHHHAAQKYNRPIWSRDFRHALQELDGAFLTYRTGYASFINPSVRDFLGLTISGDPELARDVIVSAIRFKQVTSLWELAQAKPDSATMSMFNADTALLVHAFARLQFGPALHWETRPDGERIGTHIDLSEEGKIGFLAGAANTLKSPETVALVGKAADFLIGKWESITPEIQHVVGILNDMSEEKWFFCNGGEAIYLKLIDNMMNELHFASADDYAVLIRFGRKAVGWTAADDARLDKALVHYERSGASDDRRNCSNISELSELRESLDRLHSEFGINLRYEIERVDEEIAERGERDAGLRSGSGGLPSNRPSRPAMSDDEVRDMFSTLWGKS